MPADIVIAWPTVESDLVACPALRAADRVIDCVCKSQCPAEYLAAVQFRAAFNADEVSLNDIPHQPGAEEAAELNADRISRNDISRAGNKAADYVVVAGNIDSRD